MGDYTLIAAGGEYSDFQYIVDLLQELVLDDHVRDDNAKVSAPEVHSYLTRVLYQRRNKFDPLYNSLVVAGVKDGKATLGYIDPLGTAFSEDFVATGYGAHLGLPLIRDR